jgi:hypothetical protein
MRRIRLLLAALFFVAAPAARAGNPPPVEFTISVSPEAGPMDEPFIVTIQVKIRGVNGPDRFWAPDFGEFVVEDQRTQQSTEWTYDNTRGQGIRVLQMRRYRLRASRAGKLKIGEAKLRLDGVEYQTRPVVVEVSAPGTPVTQTGDAGVNAPPSDSPTSTDPTFLHATVDRTKVFVGEQVTVTWLLYTRSDVLKFEPRPPRLDGVWVETLYEPKNYFTYREEEVSGKEYAVAVVSKRALFPTRSGKIVVPAYEADVATLYTSFASPLSLASPEIALEVKPLPPGAPPGFDPAYVGSYQVDASVDRTSLPAGESLTLTLTVEGTGPARRARVPSLTLDNFEVIAPRDFDEKVAGDGDQLRGVRRYQYLLRPAKGGKQLIGPIELSYFDPKTEKYEIARAEAVPVMVIGDPNTVGGRGGGGPGGLNLIGRDIRPTHDLPEVSSQLAWRFYRSPIFFGALAAPGALFLLVVVGDKLRERLARETPRSRWRRARGRARKRLKTAEVHIRGSRAAMFFGEMARVLAEHIEERVGEPVASLTRDHLRTFLRERGFPEETVDALVRELENCDFARFAPSASGPGEMRAALRRVRALLTAIERVRPAEKAVA